MRLFDRIISSGNADGVPLRAMAHAGKLTIVCCDPVAQMYMASPKQDWEWSDFPYAMPPWDIAFCEWNRPPFMNLGDGLQASLAETYEQLGFVSYTERQNFEIRAALNDAQELSRMVGETLPDLSNTAAVVKLAPVIAGPGGLMRFVKTHANVFLDKNGQCLGQVYQHQEHPEICGELLTNFVPIVLLSYCFANTSNTELVEVDDLAPPAKLQKRFEIPKVRRVTLKIGGGKFIRPVYKHTDQSSEPPCDDNGMPLHLCRGSFATYTAERPLFGKYVGRFWRPPHTKGKKDHGEIVKDYVVNPPADVAS